MKKSTELIDAIKAVSKEKGINEEIIFEAIETSLVSACKKNYGSTANIKVVLDRDDGDVQVFSQKTVVEFVNDENNEITIDNAKKVNINYCLGDIVDVVVTPKDFGRISAQTAKQVVVQKFREAEREILYNDYITKEKDLMTGIVQRFERKNVVVDLGRLDGIIMPSEQMPNEKYAFNERIKVYVTEVKKSSKGPVINVSRTHPDLVKRLLEQEVPEVHDGVVEIKSLAREAGSRSKIAVYSKLKEVDAVGACVGQNGSRINIIVSELNDEKIDVINWDEDPKKYIAAALNPSNVLAVVLNEEDKSAKIVVPDDQLSLAIGKEGQNARLAARLTGWKIDIKSNSQAKSTNFLESEEVKTTKIENLEELENLTNLADYDEFDEEIVNDDDN